MKYTCGIDCGSKTVKIAIFSIENHQLIDAVFIDNSVQSKENISRQISVLCNKNNISLNDIVKIASTGYGRYLIENSDFIQSEIICHAKGCHFIFPNVKTVIDIGGQDSKIITLSDNGKVLDFLMNDKCAAGTGRFLEKVASIFNMPLRNMDLCASNKDKLISISSTCVVFAESEIIGMINKGEKPENIIFAVYESIAHRIFSQSGALRITDPIAFVGGVAYHSTMRDILSDLFKVAFLIPENPSITGALGAAIIAAEKYNKSTDNV